MNQNSYRVASSFIIKLIPFCAFIILLNNTITSAQSKVKSISKMTALETGFAVPPDSIQTSVYWYWISDNISKQGVVKDLEGMKRVGINRAFIGNMGLGDVTYGKVKLFSEEWWDILHTALKTATRLGIEIGIFNCPGWSQSGGPWVKPQQSMRYLNASEIKVKGPLLIHQNLKKPNADFQDVKVIAYPAPKDYSSVSQSAKLQVSSNPVIGNLNNLIDKDESSVLLFPAAKSFTLNFATAEDYTVRSVTIYPAQVLTVLQGDLEVKINATYQKIKHFNFDYSNANISGGFKPYGPAVISIPATTGKEFRIVFDHVTVNSSLAEIKFSSYPMMDNYLEKTLAKMWANEYVYWPAYQWSPQPVITDPSFIIDPAKVLDISKYMSKDGLLNWKVPMGDWIIERSGMTPTLVTNAPASPEGKGLETDKMSKEHIKSHFDAFLGEIMKRIPAEDRKTWKVAVEDSYETGGQNWTDGQVGKFKQVYGYDPIPYIPVMGGKVVGSADQSDRFLWDIRRFVADNVAYEYVGGLRDVSHQHGLTTWLENYGHGGFPGEFLQYGGQSDEVGGEFWSEGETGAIENKGASSCAHIYGKNKVSCESFTCMGSAYSRYPATMKQRLDRFFTEGINNTLLHVYIEQATDNFPGLNSWFGNEFNRLNTWFFDMDVFLKYIKRCNLLLQQGKYVADVAYFISEDAPKMTVIQDPVLPKGYSFDYINAEVIKTRMTVKDGQLVLPDGMKYRILVLPKLATIRPELLLKIKALVEQGAVVMGPRPSRSPSLQNYGKADQEVQQLAAELWGGINGSTVKVNKFGKGMVIDGMTLEDALQLLKTIPDCKTAPADSVLFIHRELQDGSVYFLSNQKNQPVEISPEFRVKGKSPELWDATTGKTRNLPEYTQTVKTTTVPLKLAPYESIFVVFRKASVEHQTHQQNYPKPVQTIDLSNDWKVNFDLKMRGPLKSVIFKHLEDWTLNQNDSIKYYSGTAYYLKNFKLPAQDKKARVILNLGMVRAIAKVIVNGMEVGGVWTAPYQIDITSALKSGNNELKIKVVNTWQNRLIGDRNLPEKERKTQFDYSKYNLNAILQPSGLLGPVRLEVLK